MITTFSFFQIKTVICRAEQFFVGAVKKIHIFVPNFKTKIKCFQNKV